jgi:ATP-dependent helicase HepA
MLLHPNTSNLNAFLPISPQRLVVDITGRDLSEVLPHEKLNELCSGIKRSLAPALVKEVRAELSTLLSQAQKNC